MAETNGKTRDAAASWTWDGWVAVLKWADGQETRIDITQFNTDVREAAMRNGFKQKFADSYALPMREIEVDGEKKTIRPSVEEKRAAFAATLEHMSGETGTWNAPRGEGESRSYVFEACLAQYPGLKDRAGFDAWVTAQATAKKISEAAFVKAVREFPKIAARIEVLKAERGIKPVDVEADMAALENLPTDAGETPNE